MVTVPGPGWDESQATMSTPFTAFTGQGWADSPHCLFQWNRAVELNGSFLAPTASDKDQMGQVAKNRDYLEGWSAWQTLVY